MAQRPQSPLVVDPLPSGSEFKKRRHIALAVRSVAVSLLLIDGVRIRGRKPITAFLHANDS